MSFTPGPWETDKIAVRSSGPDGRQICLCEITVRGRPYDETYDEAIANAHRIKTAVNAYPLLDEMAKALKSMDDALCAGFETQEGRMSGRKALIAARTALARFRELQGGATKAQGQEVAPDGRASSVSGGKSQ